MKGVFGGVVCVEQNRQVLRCCTHDGNLLCMSAERLIQTRFVLKREEFGKAHRLVLRNLPTKAKLVGWVQCVLIITLLILPVAYRPNGELKFFPLIYCALVWLVVFTGQIARSGLLNLQFARIGGDEILYEFDETGFRCSEPNSELHLHWPGIRNVLEAETLFVVLASDLLFYTIPKRALEPDALISLQRLVAEKMPVRQS